MYCFFISSLHSQIALFLLWLTQELEPRIQTASELVKTQLAENDKGAFLNINHILWPRAVRLWELDPSFQQTASELVKAQLAENDKGVFKSYDVLNISRILWPRGSGN